MMDPYVYIGVDDVSMTVLGTILNEPICNSCVIISSIASLVFPFAVDVGGNLCPIRRTFCFSTDSLFSCYKRGNTEAYLRHVYGITMF